MPIDASRRAAFLRLGSRPIPRVMRMMRIAASLGYETLFYGAFRDSGLARKDEWEDLPIVRIGSKFPLLNGTRPLTYARGVLHYAFSALYNLLRLRPTVVHASDFECGVPASLYHSICGGRFIYNIHDNLAQRYSVGRLLSWLLNICEGLVVRISSVTLVPEGFRRDALPSWCRSKVLVVRNTPEDPGFSPRRRSAGDPIKLFFGGWLDKGRGLEGLASIVLNNPDIELVVAGEGSASTIDWLQSLPRVEYLGFLTHSMVLEQTHRCDFVVALYDPRRPINIFAASNKIAEAFAIGRPVLVNSEAKIAAYVREKKCGITVPYARTEDAALSLRELATDHSKYEAASRAARLCYDMDYHFDVVRPTMIRAFGVQCSSAA